MLTNRGQWCEGKNVQWGTLEGSKGVETMIEGVSEIMTIEGTEKYLKIAKKDV